MEIKKEIESIIGEIIEIRREFHMNPELSEEEFETQKRIMKYLDRWNIEYESVAETGVVGIIRGKKPGKTVGVRADIDALPIQEENDLAYRSKNPNVMHACGHDVHTAINLGIARFFKGKEEDLVGNIKLFFQPAEETIGGASRMIEEGVLENPRVDYVLGLHVNTDLEVGEIGIKEGKVNAATNEFTIRVSGRAGHAAYPEESVDAIIIAANIITNLQTLVSRNTSPINPVVVSIGRINGGVKNNVIADRVVLSGTLRTLDQETREFSKNRLREIAQSTAGVFGGSVEVDFPVDGAFAPLVNDKDVVDLVVGVGEEVVGKENIYFKEKPSMGGDDFSFFAQEVPSTYFNLGCGNELKGCNYPAHNENFKIDEDCIQYGLEIQIKSILKLLQR